MTRAGAAFPQRPGDVPERASLDEMAGALGEHRGRLVDARHDVGEPQSARQVAGHALAALALAHALAERALCSRWCDVADALAHGATLDQVADAMGVTEAEARAGLLLWCEGQERSHARYGGRLGGLTPAAAGEVRALVGEHR